MQSRALRHFVATSSALIVFGLAATHPQADELDRFGPATSAGVGGVAFLDDTAAASLSNPAHLTRVGAKLALAVEISWLAARIHPWERPSGVDVGDAIYADATPLAGWPVEGQRPLPSAELPARRDTDGGASAHSLQLGVSRTMWDILAFGLTLSLPLDAIQAGQSHFIDEREQYFSNQLHWFYLGGEQRRMTSHAAFAAEVLPGVSIGAGLFLEQLTTSHVDIYIDDVLDPSATLQNIETHVAPIVAPSAGFVLGPWRGIQTALSWQAERKAEILTESRVLTRGLELGEDEARAKTKVHYIQGFVPMRAEAAVVWEPEGAPLGVGASGIWRHWSAYPGPLNEGLTPQLEDTIELRMAATWRGELGWEVQVGGHYAPTPVPEQSARTNLVDNDRLGASAGLLWRFGESLGGLELGLSARAAKLLMRSNQKDASVVNPVFDEFPDAVNINQEPVPESAGFQTNNPGFPGFESEGWTGAVAFTMGMEW